MLTDVIRQQKEKWEEILDIGRKEKIKYGGYRDELWTWRIAVFRGRESCIVALFRRTEAL